MKNKNRTKHEGKLKERLAASEEAVKTWEQALYNGSKPHKAVGKTIISVENIANKILEEHNIPTIRNIKEFNRSFRTKDVGKITLAVATHLFGKFKVPTYLQECWQVNDVRTFEHQNHGWRRHYNLVETVQINNDEIKMRQEWFLVAASGGSLYKEKTKGRLTKAETHMFLTCPLQVNFREAFIYAIASSYTDNLAKRTQIMKTKLNELGGVNWIADRTMWREIIQFYCANNITFGEMNNLIDYFQHMDNVAAQNKQHYSLKGRNLHSLQRQMQDWHYELARVKRMGNATWEGIPVENSEFELNKFPSVTWIFEQIKTSKALAAEGTAMHHCVYSYQAQCIKGLCSIWSVKKFVPKKSIGNERVLTLEINNNDEIVQIKRFANLQPKNDELDAVRHWANTNMLTIRRYY